MTRANDREWDDELGIALAELDFGDRKALLRSIVQDVRSKDRRTGGKLYIILTHEPTGVSIKHLCGASRAQADRDAFLVLVDRLEELSVSRGDHRKK